MTMKRVLIGSPIRQKAAILNEFLRSLEHLNMQSTSADCLFIDDNLEAESSALLRTFPGVQGGTVDLLCVQPQDTYLCDEKTHHWNENLIWRVGAFKDTILDVGRKRQYDYVFLVDSDLVLHPDILVSLMNAQKDIVSAVFWTAWQPGVQMLPQVWLCDQYTLYQAARNERLSSEEIQARTSAFLKQLRIPGLYRVGGLGACTLISRRSLDVGVSFKEIPNVSFWGEDRHFCIRAAALGLELWADTRLPVFHIYRESDLPAARKFYCDTHRSTLEQRLTQIVRTALETLGTTDYRTMTGREGFEFLTEECQRTLAETGATDPEVAAQKQTITRATVQEVEVQVSGNRASARARVLSEGIEQNIPFREEFIGLVGLGQCEGRWLITDLTFLPSQSQKNTSDSATGPNQPPAYIKKRPRIVLSMLVRNEANRYLPFILRQAACLVDSAVILDDASTDNTVDVCRQLLEGIPLQIVSRTTSGFSKEHELRRQQWEMAVSTGAEWVLTLDADEIFEPACTQVIPQLAARKDINFVRFRLYDMWDLDHYREDSLWKAHTAFWPFMVRPLNGIAYRWKETDQHCGRFPLNALVLPGADSCLRVKHYGWANPIDRIKKYERYLQLDPDGRFGIMEQYKSILDAKPRLVKWSDVDEDVNAIQILRSNGQ